jgi:hypothetical protein
MINSAKDFIKFELLAMDLKYPIISKFKENNRDLLKEVSYRLNNGDSASKIKKYIYLKLKALYEMVSNDLLCLSIEQGNLMLDIKNYKINENNTLVMGLNLEELITGRIHYHTNLILQDYIREDLKVNAIKRKTLNSLISLNSDYLKANRESIYQTIEENNDIKGWLYTAVLDRRTSGLCISLNNRFYSAKVYKNRGSVPYRPNVNTHRNCRSLLITIFKDDNVNDYKSIGLKEFLKDEKYEAKKLLGIKKYKLFVENKLDIKDVFNFKNNKFYTNKEIIANLK